MADDIIVIGAGVAGLSTGCYAQMNGYQARIFEMHDKPGGVCTAWKRKGYTFDGCVHWLMGSAPASSFHVIWSELGALQDREFAHFDEFAHIIDAEGREIVLHTDMDKLAAHMIELAPGDEKAIRGMANTIKRLSTFDPPIILCARERMGPIEGLKALWAVLPLADVFWRLNKLDWASYVERFEDPWLRDMLTKVYPPGFPTITVLVVMATQYARAGGYPLGGSLPFVRAIEKRFLELGGQVTYKTRVTEIIVEDDRAVGVRLEDGTEHRADTIVSAADGHTTIFDMLGGRYIDPTIQRYYDELPPFEPNVLVSLGLDKDLSDHPHGVAYFLDQPITIAGQEIERLSFRHFAYDPHMAPKGHTTCSATFDTDWEAWEKLGEDRDAYEAEKERIAQQVIATLDARIPGLADAVRAVDVATPLTTVRYTGNWRGSPEGWMFSHEVMAMMMKGGMKKTLPGLERFHMVGQWVEPGGGLPPAAKCGRDLIQNLCHRDGRKFVTTMPE
jgi:phytoene dehydrogenase-like protein